MQISAVRYTKGLEIMIENILVILANLTSIILWLPQAKTTWKYRREPEALKAISYGTLIMAGLNTTFWGVYGLIIQNYGLAFATILILPTTLFTLFLKFNTRKLQFQKI